jgi:UDP-N-acetylglucosamine 4-epimerase
MSNDVLSEEPAWLERLRTRLGSERTWLVTGAAGFIGSNLVEALLKLDQKVVGLDNFITGHKRNLGHVKMSVGVDRWQKFDFVEGDIRNSETCLTVCRGADTVLHQAALGSVPRSLADPFSSNDHNVSGFLNMLISAKECGVRNFVYASSSSVYGDDPGLPKVEGRRGNPLSPYAASKAINELYADVFQRSYDIKPIGLRYFNVFGRRQDPDGAYAAVMPKWFAALVKGEEIYINGDGETSRDFCYVDNAVQANILAGSTDKGDAMGKAYNVACGSRTSLNELYKMIRSEVALDLPQANGREPIYREFRAGDVRHSLADTSLIRKNLGYDPSHTVADGLTEAAKWYVSQLS